MKEETDEEWLTRFAESCRYPFSKLLGDGRYAVIVPKIYTWAVGTGTVGDEWTLADHWCYHHPEQAIKAFLAWDGQGEPEGWFRNPPSGRRVSEGPYEYDDERRLVPIGTVYTRH